IINGGTLNTASGQILKIHAYEIYIDSTSSINANARGYSGGAGVSCPNDGGDGTSYDGTPGTGGGRGATHEGDDGEDGSGGGGGGYGGAGGMGGEGWSAEAGASGSEPGAGGSVYGSSSDESLYLGSGGGGGTGSCYSGNSGTGGSGGMGGGGILLDAKNVTVEGQLSANGGDGFDGSGCSSSYGCGGGGGGSGGSIIIEGENVTISGMITANGGSGGDYQGGPYGGGGGGGGGGRVKIFYETLSDTGSTITVSGGAAGVSGGSSTYDPEAGTDGTIYNTSQTYTPTFNLTVPGPSVTTGGEENKSDELTFKENGYYISNVFDTESVNVQYQKIYWTSQENENTTVTVYTRSSSDGSDWSLWFQEVNNSGVDAPNNRYIQYKVELSTTNNKQTPYFYENVIKYLIATAGFVNMKSSGTALTATNPYNCGELNQTNPTCYPTWSVTPTEAGNYLVRIFANGSAGNIVEVASEVRNITVMINTFILNFTSNQSLVARGGTVKLSADLVDDLGQHLSNKNITFWDSTDNYYIGSNLTGSPATVIYTIPQTASLGTHTLNASYAGNSSEFLNPSSSTTVLKVTSVPQIRDVTAIPQTVGYGFNVTIRANVTDEVGVDKVFVNITKPNGESIFVEMINVYDSIYEYNFSDTWLKGTYHYFIWANNTDGISNQSEIKEFYANATLDLAIDVEKDKYKANEYVYLSNCRHDWWNCSWLYRRAIEIRENSGETLTDFPINLTINTKNLISEGKLQESCSDLRFIYEKPIYELPVTIDNTRYGERINETIKIAIYDSNILAKIKSKNEIRLFNSSVEEPYENFEYLPFWIQTLTDEELILWVKVPHIPAYGQKTIYLYYGNPSANNAENYNKTFDEIIGEAGTFATDHNWYSVNFMGSYVQNPVIITSMTTENEGGSGTASAAVARIRNLNTAGFEASAEEYPSGDSLHLTENFSYVAIKEGTWIVAGLLLEAGTSTTTSSYTTLTFNNNFDSTPVILTHINSYNEADSSSLGSHTREDNPTASTIDVKIEEETDTSHASETIGYIAIQQGGIDNIIEAYKTGRAVDDTWYSISFQKEFSSTPVLVGKFMTEYGSDNSEERIRNLDTQGFEVHIEETPAYPPGTHTTEEFGYLAVKEGLIRGIQYKAQPSISLGSETVVGKTYQKLPYWIESGCNSTDTKVWTQIPFLEANGNAKIYMYYGNSNAEAESDEISEFSYSLKRGTYVVLGIQDSALDIASFSNNTEIELGTTSTTLDEYETYTISSSDVTLGSLLESTSPVSSGTKSSGDGAPLTPLIFKGKLFEIPVSRYNPIYFDFYALEDTQIKIYNSTGSGWNLVETFNLNKGSAVSKSYTGTDTDIGVEISYLINSTGDILVFFRGNVDDYMPLVPAGKEFYVEPSNYMQIGAVFDNTQVTIYYSDGTSTSFILNAGQAWTSSSLGADGTADSARIVANNSIFAYQEADSDGTEVTPGLPPKLMDYIFVFPQNAEYFVAVTLTNRTTNCTLYDSSGAIDNSWEVTANYPYPGKIDYGTGQDGTTYIYAGWKLICNNPVAIYYEEATNDAETLLYGPKAHMQIGDVSYSISGIEEDRYVKLKNYGNTSVKGYLWMVVQEKTDTGWKNMIPPVLDDRPDNLRILNPGEEINLTQLWNSNPWYTNRHKPGKYRAYAAFVDPDGNVLVSAIYGNVEDWDEFEIIKAVLELTDLTHENEFEHSINEYEILDRIDWINVTVTAINNTALGANITLNVLNWNKNPVSWGPNETKLCGDIPENQSCQRRWDNSSHGYLIPEDASPGSYTFFWNVTMRLENGDLRFNDSYSFIIHNIPSTFSSSLSKSRLYKPDSTIYNFTFTNQWSKNLTDVYVRINCPEVEGFNCSCLYGSQGGEVCYIGNVSALETLTISFNISVNDSTPVDDYFVNITLNYTNPGNEYKEWKEYETKKIEVRSPNLLEITLYNIPENYTRGYLYNLSAYANNTASFTSHNVWLNYTLPIGWINVSGNLSQYAATLAPSELIWNNITVNVTYSASLGEQEIRLDSVSDEGQEDWKIKTVYVWAETSLINFQANDSTPDRSDTIQLQVKLVYDNGNPISGEVVEFYDENESLYIGSSVTNSQGIAVIEYQIPSNALLGIHIINVSYNGSSSLYTLPSTSTMTIDVHQKPTITNITIVPEVIGYGFNVTIRANATDIDDGIDKVFAKVKFPNGTLYWFEMTNISKDIYEVNLTDLWNYGEYNVTIWANDSINSIVESSVHHFYLKVRANVFVRTENETYAPATYVNLTSGNYWWDYKWDYRKEINISENSGNNLSEYQILIILNTTNFNYSKTNDNGSDIRFIFFNETSKKNIEIPYYIEEWNSSGESKIWVKIPYIEASSNTTIYLYYGNPDAESKSNISETFSYSEPRVIGYVVSDRISETTGLSILSLCNNNQIQVGSS
ncbi:MAG: hypothetical protein DRO95_04840, partial [Candidatus Altiarchaeales archaeon]